ncbi:circadian clock-controlled protein daywake-like [Zerene cesonia]|uniref:circadian clock-controlled protein daywake-like n=1 Tax=Zerene cesonia TaxID=33412 RepID=UPI0018E4F873|nr:circadian clock-controlled protein daywake-like [Zerene cesonia]
MKRLSIFVFLAALFSTNAEDGFLPSYITPCQLSKDSFKNCVREQIEKTLPIFAKGIPELGVPSIDPADLDDIHIDGNGLKLTFTKAKLHGLSDIQLTDLTIDIGEKEETFKLDLVGNLSVSSLYNADGKILILPIKGDGDANIYCTNVKVQINSKLNHFKDSKGEHFKLTTPNYKYDIESTRFDFKNLFNGNKQLAETTLQFANENWRQLMDDLAPPVIKQIVKTIVKSINKFFSKVTISRIVRDYTEA